MTAGRRQLLPRLVANIVIVGLGAALLYVSLGVTHALTLGRTNPEAASFWPSPTVRLAEAEERRGGGPAGRTAAAAVGLDVWRAEPLSIGALHLIATASAFEGAGDRTDRLYRYIESLSRRDQFTQIWLMNSGLASDDVGQTMLHADRALRSSARSRSYLFQLLTLSAGSSPRVRAGLAGLIAARPDYWAPLYDSLLESRSAGEILPDVLRAARLRVEEPADQQYIQASVSRLIELGRLDQALDAHVLYFPDRRGQALVNGGFETDPRLFPFNWQIDPDAYLGEGGIGRDARRDRALIYNFPTDGQKMIAQQILLVPAGSYELSYRFQSDAGTAPKAVLSCLRGGRPPAALSPLAISGDRATLSFTTAPDCGYYLLALMSGGSRSGWIDDVAVASAGRAPAAPSRT